jgi:hypothetical protein
MHRRRTENECQKGTFMLGIQRNYCDCFLVNSARPPFMAQVLFTELPTSTKNAELVTKLDCLKVVVHRDSVRRARWAGDCGLPFGSQRLPIGDERRWAESNRARGHAMSTLNTSRNARRPSGVTEIARVPEMRATHPRSNAVRQIEAPTIPAM